MRYKKAMGLLFASVVAVFATGAMLHVARPIARRIGLTDTPGGRKVHAEPVPLVGGISIFFGFCLALLVAGIPLGSLRALIAGSGLLLVVGVLDDFRELSPRSRFMAQIIAALVMSLWGQVYLEEFGNLFGLGSLTLGWLALPISVFCVVGVINALNMADGVDGIASSAVLICVAGMGFLQWTATGTLPAHLLLLEACVAAFWLANAGIVFRGPARVFLGDGGSLFLGFVVAWHLVGLSQGDSSRVIAPVTALWLFALPLLDTVYVMLRRLRSGMSPFSGGRDHLHHLFLNAGLSPRQTLLWYVTVMGFMSLVGIWTQVAGWPEWLSFGLFLCTAAGYWRALDQCWNSRTLWGRHFVAEQEHTTR